MFNDFASYSGGGLDGSPAAMGGQFDSVVGLNTPPVDVIGEYGDLASEIVEASGGGSEMVFTNSQHQGNASWYVEEENPVLSLLGRKFEEIKEVMGEPDDVGYDSQYGPHRYMLYVRGDGHLRFCSPENLDNLRAISIIMESTGEVLNVEVGMTFEEIQGVLGEPDYGPKSDMAERYYLEYILEDQIYVSFSASSDDGPTDDAFIKLKDWSQ